MRNTAVALVTGANKGIGYRIVEQLAAAGAIVMLGSRDPDRGREAAARLQAGGRQVHDLRLDVTDDGTIAEAARSIDEQFGRLDILVNNAGVAGAGQQPGEVDLAAVQGVFATNVLGVIAVTEAMLPLLRRSSAPRIVNVSSAVGSLAGASDPESPLAGLPASVGYVPSKTALTSLTVQYAKALRAEGMLVNAADPGYCATDLNNHRGYRTADQGAAVAVRLATLPPDGPTGGLFGEGARVPW
ncbi:MAG: SDR family oxidoreductase [Candidatus Dormibacteraceae bacterium]